MDVDADDQQRLLDPITYFEIGHHTFAWRGPRCHEIETRRARLNDTLIFDILLSSGGIRNPDILFPPADVPALKRLLDAIDNSKYDMLKKECLVYILLKWHRDGREHRFEEDRCIPPQFVALADAYWYLDSGDDIPRAVSILSDCRLNRDYASKILHAISLHPDANPLIIKYIRTAKPLLTEPDDIELYTVALAQSSFLEAWQFQRTFPEQDLMRERLFRRLVGWCVTPIPRSQALLQLLSFPLSQYEETLLNSIALGVSASSSTSSPTTSERAIIQDLVCTRLIQNGRYTEAIKMDKRFSLCPFTTPSSTEDHTTSSAQAKMHERNRMMHDVYTALPATEKIILDAELEAMVKGKATAISGALAANGMVTPKEPSGKGNLSLSTSWEEVQLSQSAINHATLGASSRDALNASISKRSGGPRFGGSSISLLNQSTSKAIPSINLLTSSLQQSGFSVLGSSTAYDSQLRTSFPTIPVSTMSVSALHSSASRPNVNTSTKMHTALGTSTSGGLQFPLVHQGTSAQGAGEQAQGLRPAPFVPANSVRNAFYEPPAPKDQTRKHGVTVDLEGIEPRSRIRTHLEALPDADEIGGEDERMQREDSLDDDGPDREQELVNERRRGEDSGRDREEEVNGLEYSLFSGTHETGRHPAKKQSGPRKSRVPPGSFIPSDDDDMDEDEDEGVDEDYETLYQQELAKAKETVNRQVGLLPKKRSPRMQGASANADTEMRSAKSRSGASVSASVKESKVRTKTKAKAAKDQNESSHKHKGKDRDKQRHQSRDKDKDLERSIPGSLADTQHQELDSEADDVVMPLPSSSAKHVGASTKKTSTRRSRESTTSLDGDHEEPQPRRRSSRLSAVSSRTAADEVRERGRRKR